MTYPIEWKEEKTRGITVSKDAVIGKGTLEEIKQFMPLDRKQYTESNIPIRISEEDLGTTEWDAPPMKIGKSWYNSKRLYQILEEIYDKDVLLSTGRRAKKKFQGKIIWVKAIIIKEELIPIIFYNDEKTAYLLAPRIEPEEEDDD